MATWTRAFGNGEPLATAVARHAYRQVRRWLEEDGDLS
jgi:hypothetical protein